ncbi:hypothetical protein Tco_0328828 [Tanacetum coccineum]
MSNYDSLLENRRELAPINSNSTEKFMKLENDPEEDIHLIKATFALEIEPDSGELISAVMDDIFEGNEDKCFDPGGGGIDASPNFLLPPASPPISQDKGKCKLETRTKTIAIKSFLRRIQIAPDFEDSRAEFCSSFT